GAGRPGGTADAGRSGRAGATTGEADGAVLDRLRAWRAGVAAERGVPAFRVLPDVALEALAAAMPTGPAELQRVHGLGQTRLREYGPDLLRVVAGEDVLAGRGRTPRR
ncbi:HRDC domain-containing protein, partial [Cellulomonas sp. 179-A 9B4 NHS]|uniref:HRDC domain-containing protein n=1 Tax=Cellulomonas sp. 179-A 9B4 NHS TaxID=3142379 RepID=UPI0039A3F1D9